MKTEKDIERSVVRVVESHGGKCLKWVCPGHRGVPDRIALLPGGRVIFVELKRPTGGIIAPLQLWWASELRSLGFLHFFIKNDDDVARLDDFLRVAEREGYYGG